jgi:hypothetical protein
MAFLGPMTAMNGVLLWLVDCGHFRSAATGAGGGSWRNGPVSLSNFKENWP